MQRNGISEDQVTQVRGFADQRLRKKDQPLDPSNRRISLIVQYLSKPAQPPEAAGAEKVAEKVADKAGEKQGEKTDPKPAEVKADAPGAATERTAPVSAEKKKE